MPPLRSPGWVLLLSLTLGCGRAAGLAFPATGPLSADLDFTSLFHGVDERVPVDALKFGARVFDRFLEQA